MLGLDLDRPMVHLGGAGVRLGLDFMGMGELGILGGLRRLLGRALVLECARLPLPRPLRSSACGVGVGLIVHTSPMPADAERNQGSHRVRV